MNFGAIQRLRFLIENWTGRFFKKGENPFYSLGALSFFFFWILLGTGIYLFFVYRLNIDGAYDSIQYLTDHQPWWGGLIRSLHRYAADGLVIAMILHGLRTFLANQYRFARWLAWVSGIIALGFIWIEGVLGYWMVWDNRAHIIALKTAEFLNFLPIIGVELPRAFLSRDLMTNLFFLIIIALHIALPLFMLILLWLHVSRISRPTINPPAGIMLASFFSLLVVSAIRPAVSGPPADPARLAIGIPIDWFYLAAYPLFNTLATGWAWLLLSAGTILLLALPWIGAPRRREPVSLALKRCNACEICYDDCPYEAITMRPRTDLRPYDTEAFVEPDLCVSCGICLGSCSTAALSLPDFGMIRLVNEVRKRALLPKTDETGPLTVEFLCEKALPAGRLKEAVSRVNPLIIPCLGAIHPTVIEQSIRAGASQILLAGCAEGDCHFLTGNLLLQERLARKQVSSKKGKAGISNIRTFLFSPEGAEEAIGEMERFQKGAQIERFSPSGFHRYEWVKILAAGVVIFLPALLVLFGSGYPAYSFYHREDSLLVVSLKVTASPLHCRELSQGELERLPEHMRTPLECSRKRWPVSVRLDLDGENRLEKEYPPGGLWSDGPAFVYEKFKVKPGMHEVRLVMKESPTAPGQVRMEQIDFQPGRAVVLNLLPAR
jgi:ferredoxin/coenzyme F420-reducing hydrogenase delta subunit